eukprot:10723146-Alexandrium_andersonii.AAC.1
MVLVVLGAFTVLRTVLWVLGRIGLTMARWAANQPLFEERPALIASCRTLPYTARGMGASTTLIHDVFA